MARDHGLPQVGEKQRPSRVRVGILGLDLCRDDIDFGLRFPDALVRNRLAEADYLQGIRPNDYLLADWAVSVVSSSIKKTQDLGA